MNLKLQMKSLEEIDVFIFDTLTGILFDTVPEYKEIVEMGEDSFFSDRLTYLFMNEFATYLGGQIKSDRTSAFVESSFDYINYIGQSHNCEIINIVHVGILEILYTEEGVDREWVKMNLSEKLQPYFEAWSKYYR
ncbi:hypothetical protein [Sphingobacterium sp. GVS05A]|jgi:hypothetical protein|uniref:DUF7674 family protein n=1 Tax=Sphingobacterium sp. GVS05A TaxID=2862679 RepID=UPI001CBB58F4|nr:hypothetical protein [Sphingobacterium sp. GVS05A]